MSQEVICTVPAHLLLGVAQRLYSYDKTWLALALLHVVLEQHPEYEQARSLYANMTGKDPSEYPLEKHNRIQYDFEKKKFFVYDAISGNSAFFDDQASAEASL